MLPAGLKRRDAVPAPASRAPQTRADETEVAMSPDRTITPEAVPNSPLGDSVEIPVKVGNSGSPS